MSDPKKKSLDTLAVHGGEPRRHPYAALAAPIVQTATFTFSSTAELLSFLQGELPDAEEYGRYGNPSVRLVEEKIASLEAVDDGLAFGSGMAAVTTSILALVKSGSHVILFRDCYRRTRQFVRDVLGRFGVTHSIVESVSEMESALRAETRLVICEAPTNPFQRVVDLARVAEICRAKRVKTLVDSTFATPINLRPADLGIDLVVHSATKYLAGHNDVLGGVVCGSRGLVSLIRDLRHCIGGIMDPHAAYLVHRGIKTLAIRVARQNESALALARFLEADDRIKVVHYPGLPSHSSYEVASRLMSGFGGVVTFEVNASQEETSRFVDACKIPRIGPSLGGVESLIEQPALMSYYGMPREEREALGMVGGLVRYAVGIEDAQELIADTEAALARLR